MLERVDTNIVAFSRFLIVDDEAPGQDAAGAADADLQRLGQTVPEVQGPLPPLGGWIGRPFQQTHWNKVWQQEKRTSNEKVGWLRGVGLRVLSQLSPENTKSRKTCGQGHLIIPGLPFILLRVSASPRPTITPGSRPGHLHEATLPSPMPNFLRMVTPESKPSTCINMSAT